MAYPIQIHSRVGKDGVLTLRIPLQPSDADADVVVTVEKVASAQRPEPAGASWHRFVEETYGSCEGLNLERPEQGAFEKREALE